ncbi:alpha/beta hydrolase [Allokutzneria sp. A3M-2-11 16]|uniref:alpha/beta fold hydrolase n=1 Tax=Allokutzneria sp. A3M-2-11 16 TaxID=2962043 RepID=UPI0020B8C038|nr:alpha/beta hydrolase [Allokutzneria sp. A3M-2-11 16]MCP3798344.1 alpha/beta hydrolase [Allokutzneria sp. A3M-2-11 16]
MLRRSAFGEPGRTRTRDGRLLHHVTLGTGSPTVVFEAGMGANRGTWGLVQREVAVRTRTLAYDRAGLGRSDPAPAGLRRMATDLEDVLCADHDTRFVLVGHSLGGVLARWVAQRQPGMVAGLVLVDQVEEGIEDYHDRARARAVATGYTLGAAFAGVLRPLLMKVLHKNFPPEMAAELISEEVNSRALRTGAEEVLAMAAGLRELMAGTELPDIPVTVISAGRCGRAERPPRPVLIAAHRRFAERFPQGRHVVAERADHLVPLQQPELIVREALRLVDAGFRL